jgi:outer membrane receptor protein involved in Fe transport
MDQAARLPVAQRYVKWSPAHQNWDLRFWGNNITGKKYYSCESAYAFGDIGSAAAPATYGVRFDVHF